MIVFNQKYTHFFVFFKPMLFLFDTRVIPFGRFDLIASLLEFQQSFTHFVFPFFFPSFILASRWQVKEASASTRVKKGMQRGTTPTTK